MGGFLGGAVVKNLPTDAGAAEDMCSILGWEDPLKKGMATYFSIVAREIPWTKEPSGLQSMGSQKNETQLSY